jgi:type III pantothenate kinase
MILEIDMGNTRLKWRLREQQATLSQGFIGTEKSLDLLICDFEPYRHAINAVFVASVVGEELEQMLINWCAAHLGLLPEFARSGKKCGLVRNGYREPRLLGVDRWLGIVAAYHLVNKACIVISCGTAMTLDLVARDGEHLGGFIAPGLSLMLDSLTSGTRQIKLTQPISALNVSPATSTADAVYSACTAMMIGLVDNGVRHLHKFDQNLEFQIIFTGGDAVKLLPFYPQARLIPDLVLDGLVYVLDYPQ